MIEAPEPEIQANLERAKASIQAARILLNTGYPDFAASRAYYAVFYAASAILLAENLEFTTHTGVLRAIHLQFVKTGRLDRQFGQTINWLAELRNIGDYGELQHVPLEEAETAIAAAETFLEQIQIILHRRSEESGHS